MKNVHLDNFCEQILLGNSLDEKLNFPENIILNEYSEYKNLPRCPGRPEALKFNTGKSMKLPSVHLLDEERNRGILLHFFLNHELLALEIMALTLLKFPELPDSFKRGMILVRTPMPRAST